MLVGTAKSSTAVAPKAATISGRSISGLRDFKGRETCVCARVCLCVCVRACMHTMSVHVHMRAHVT